MLPQEGDQPVAPSLAAEPAEGIEQRQIWFLSPVRLDALASRDPDARVGGDALEKGLDHPRLADARLAGHEDDLSHAAPRRIEPCPELAQSGLPAHEVGRPAIAGAAAEGGGHRRPPRRLTARRSRVDVGDVGDEPVPPPVHRGHEPGCADLIAESLPDLPNADLEHCVAHHGPGPDALEQHVLSDELTVALNEAVQHGKGLGRQVNFRRASPQQRIIRIEPKGREPQASRWLYLHCLVPPLAHFHDASISRRPDCRRDVGLSSRKTTTGRVASEGRLPPRLVRNAPGQGVCKSERPPRWGGGRLRMMDCRGTSWTVSKQPSRHARPRGSLVAVSRGALTRMRSRCGTPQDPRQCSGRGRSDIEPPRGSDARVLLDATLSDCCPRCCPNGVRRNDKS